MASWNVYLTIDKRAPSNQKWPLGLRCRMRGHYLPHSFRTAKLQLFFWTCKIKCKQIGAAVTRGTAIQGTDTTPTAKTRPQYNLMRLWLFCCKGTTLPWICQIWMMAFCIWRDLFAWLAHVVAVYFNVVSVTVAGNYSGSEIVSTTPHVFTISTFHVFVTRLSSLFVFFIFILAFASLILLTLCLRLNLNTTFALIQWH